MTLTQVSSPMLRTSSTLPTRVVLKLRDMNHALFAGRKFNERAEGHNTGNLAVEHIANLRITDDAVDDLERTAAGLDIGRWK